MRIHIGSRIRHAWNAFVDGPNNNFDDYGIGSYFRPDRPFMSMGNERSIINSIYNRIAVDAAAINIRHVYLDEHRRYMDDVDSSLNQCLKLSANKDQTGRSLIHDIVLSCLDEGYVAVVPVDTIGDPFTSSSYEIKSLRTGKITQWFPNHVEVELYNDQNGTHQTVKLLKSMVAIIENPFYSVMNGPNSTMQRLIRKLNLMDIVDEKQSAGKLDLIIQLPYIIKTPAKREQAEKRRKDIEAQLEGSKYGIAYTDGTEKVTQLNRPVENTLLNQIEYLTKQLFAQLGITQGILDGSASEEEMLNYTNRIVEPIVAAIVDEMKRKFLTKTARSQGQSVWYFIDPFRLVPVSKMSELADKFSRNEILTTNEIRQIMGMRPSKDPHADELRNKNLNAPKSALQAETGQNEVPEQDSMNSDKEFIQASMELEDTFSEAFAQLDEVDNEINILEGELGGDIKHYASEYYDPVKAHEYYMRNRELKGKRSTAGLNKEGREAARYIRENLNTERKGKVTESKTSTKEKIDSARETTHYAIDRIKEETKKSVETYKNASYAKIDSLRAKLKSMSKEDRTAHKDEIYDNIKELREDNRNTRTSLMEDYKTERTALMDEYRTESSNLRGAHREATDNLKTEYDTKYENELAKLKEQPEFTSKRRKSQ